MNLRQRLTNILTATATVIPAFATYECLSGYARKVNGSLHFSGDFYVTPPQPDLSLIQYLDNEWIFGILASFSLPFIFTAGFSFLVGTGFKAWHKAKQEETK